MSEIDEAIDRLLAETSTYFVVIAYEVGEDWESN